MTTYLNLVLIATLAIVHTGTALRCWTCSSESDGQCSDHFNTTRYSRYYNTYSGNQHQVQLQNCDENVRSTYGANTQKPVCMKKKQTTYGKTTYMRQCRYLHFEEKLGECPPETTSQATTIDFCEYCDYDGCNSAVSVSQTLFVSLLLPIAMFLYARK